MDTPVQCMVCGMEIGKHSCSKCGKVVGEKCIDSSIGLCVACKKGPNVENNMELVK